MHYKNESLINSYTIHVVDVKIHKSTLLNKNKKKNRKKDSINPNCSSGFNFILLCLSYNIKEIVVNSAQPLFIYVRSLYLQMHL